MDKMAKIDFPKWSGKQSKVREKSVKSQGILKTILSGNPGNGANQFVTTVSETAVFVAKQSLGR